MIIGVGTDLVEVKRVERAIKRFGERFVRKILCVSEYRCYSNDRIAAYVARQFSAKEAVSKALGTGMSGGINFHNIEIIREESGAPVVKLVGAAKAYAESRGISEFHVSLSDEREYAVAYVIASDGA